MNTFYNLPKDGRIDMSLVSEQTHELLCIIVDLNANWWTQTGSFNVVQFTDSLIAFCKMYVKMSNSKELAVLAVTNNRSGYLYNSEMKPSELEKKEMNYTSVFTENFQMIFLEYKIRNNIKMIMDSCTNFSPTVNMSDGLIKALCYYHRRSNYHESNKLTKTFYGRFLVIRTTAPDNNSFFISIMNGIFSAEKLHICIDVCILQTQSDKNGRHPTVENNKSDQSDYPNNVATNNNTSLVSGGMTCHNSSGHNSTGGSTNPREFGSTLNIWRQAADMTHGIYLVINKQLEMLPIMIALLLPDKYSRDHLVTSIKTNYFGNLENNNSSLNLMDLHNDSKKMMECQDLLDFRACCFCHGNLINVGYVCSLCLAVFCQYNLTCRCCKQIIDKQQKIPKDAK